MIASLSVFLGLDTVHQTQNRCNPVRVLTTLLVLYDAFPRCDGIDNDRDDERDGGHEACLWAQRRVGRGRGGADAVHGQLQETIIAAVGAV